MVKNRLLEIRFNLKYKKQKDFAEFLGVSQVNYNKWENNSSQPGIEFVLLICNKLELNIKDIFYIVE